ncbi:hypothetical protein FSP39_022088 [Pinctada imbricata]|uniref:C1q domain-containing protein n=1 Tax=Pinctada imbricata TaxID=66713 RepID=A0AA88YK59_PINIB|nr:hypothetical protein FSP39_022088 [Pinctada imbricata]
MDNINGGETIVFDKCTENQGQGYNPATGKFTAPRDGTYVFTWTIITNGNNHRINVDLNLNGSLLGRAQSDSRSGRQNGSGSNTVVVNLTRDDVLYLSCGDWGGRHEHRIYGHTHSTFSGWTIN